MINPQECAERIILNDPDLAEPLFDLLLCAVEPGFKDSNEFDDIKQMLYLKIQHCRESRRRYEKSRTEKVSRDDDPAEIQPVHSAAEQSH